MANRYTEVPTRDGKIVCEICDKTFKSMGCHLKKVHDILITDYLIKFNHNPYTSLVIPELSRQISKRMKKRVAEGGIGLDYGKEANRSRKITK